MAFWFERRESEDPWGGRQPRYERLASEGDGRFFLEARLLSGESVRLQLGRFRVKFGDDWLPLQRGTEGGRRGGSRWRRVLARLHNPGGHPCACLPECWCQRSRLGYVARWHVPARWHRLPPPPGPKPGGG